MKKIIKNNQSGFTLIEMLIVVVILAIVVGMTSDMLMSLIRSNTKTQVINELEQQANFVPSKRSLLSKEVLRVDIANDIKAVITRADTPKAAITSTKAIPF